MSYTKCDDCGTELGEDEVYGEWDDLCRDCHIERKDDEEDEGSPKICSECGGQIGDDCDCPTEDASENEEHAYILEQLMAEDEVEDSLKQYVVDPTVPAKERLLLSILDAVYSAKINFQDEN